MLSKIEAIKSQLSKSEQRVADIVLAAPEAAAKTSIATLAVQAKVSQPTVIRFCRSLGCQGFQDFKVSLTHDLVSQMRYAHQDIDSNDSTGGLATKVIDATIAKLIQVRQQLDNTALEAAINLLAKAKRIEFYGLGGASVVATDAQLKFFRLGIPVVAYADTYIHNVAASLLKPGAIAVVISNSGRSKDLLRSVELALKAGAKVIAITASGSPLAQRATLAITVDVADDHDSYAPIKARIPHMVVIDILAIGVALQRGPDMLSQLAALQDLLQEKFL